MFFRVPFFSYSFKRRLYLENIFLLTRFTDEAKMIDLFPLGQIQAGEIVVINSHQVLTVGNKRKSSIQDSKMSSLKLYISPHFAKLHVPLTEQSVISFF